MRELRQRAAAVTVQDKGRVFNTDLIQALELQCLIELAETIVAGALAREESRGAHYRSDFPTRNDQRLVAAYGGSADARAVSVCPMSRSPSLGSSLSSKTLRCSGP